MAMGSRSSNDTGRLLRIAARDDDLDEVRSLLAAGADSNKADNNGRTPLSIAAVQGHTDIVQVLLAEGADTNKAGKNGWTPLYSAAVQGHTDIVRVLLADGADTNKATKYGSTPLYSAALQGHADIVRVLLADGADINKAGKDGRTPLYIAAYKGHTDIVRGLLAEGADINKASNDGRTPLYNAAREGHADIVRGLLAAGADTNKADKDGDTPLYNAAYKGHLDIVRGLLAGGADINKASNGGSTPLRMAMLTNKDETVRLLIRAGADISGVIDNPRLLSFLSKEDILNLLKFRINELKKRPSNIVNVKKEIFSLLHGYISCKDPLPRQLKDPMFQQLLSHLKDNNRVSGWDESTIDLNIISLLKDIDEEKEKGCCGGIKSKLKSCSEKIKNQLYRFLPCAESLHITNCQINSIPKVVWYILLMIMHVTDIVTDFYVGISDVSSEEVSVGSFGYFEIGLAMFALCHENIMSSLYMFKVERTILAEKTKKEEKDLNAGDWEESPLNYSENWYTQLFCKILFPFKLTKIKKKEPETHSEDRGESLQNIGEDPSVSLMIDLNEDQSESAQINWDTRIIRFFKLIREKIKVLYSIAGSILLNLLSLLMLRPVVDRFRVISHKESSIRILEIKKAHQKFLQQSYGVLEQLFELLLQMYTFQMFFRKSIEYDMDFFTRIFSLLIPLYTLPKGYLSLEKLFRSLDPLSNKLPFYSLLLILYIFITACRLFMISVILHIGSLVNYIYGYLAIRIIISICYNILMYMNWIWKNSFKDKNSFKGKDIFKSKTSKFRNTWHFIILSIRQNFILSIRHVYGYIILPHYVSYDSIRQSSHLKFDCLIFSLEAIAMLVLSEKFHDRSDKLKYFNDIGMWAGALVTVLCICFYLMTIDFLHPKYMFEKVRKEKFSLLIFKQFNFWLGFFALIAWVYAYLILKLNLHLVSSGIFIGGTFVYIVVYYLVYRFLIRAEGKKFQLKFRSDGSSDQDERYVIPRCYIPVMPPGDMRHNTRHIKPRTESDKPRKQPNFTIPTDSSLKHNTDFRNVVMNTDGVVNKDGYHLMETCL